MASQNAEDVKHLLGVISDLYKQGGGQDVKSKLLELKEMVLGLWASNVELDQENAELKKRISEKQSLKYEENVYWAENDSREKDGPYCPACHDDKGKLIRMHDNGVAYSCNVCKFVHRYVPYKPTPPIRSGYW